MELADAYRYQLQQLLPRGPAWARDKSAWLTRLLDGLAQLPAAFDQAARGLIVEANPQTTDALLLDWERVAGLPGPCAASGELSRDGRRAALVARLRAGGGQSIAYLTAVAQAMGVSISIEEFKSYCVTDDVDAELTDDAWASVFVVRVNDAAIDYFEVDSDVAEALASWRNERVVCMIEQLKPAHTLAHYGAI